MQCYIREHLCFSPHVPLPLTDPSAKNGRVSDLWNLDPRRLVETPVSGVWIALESRPPPLTT